MGARSGGRIGPQGRRGDPISQNPKAYTLNYKIQNVTLLFSPAFQNSVSTDGGIGVSGLLPLSLEMVGTRVSRLTMGALRLKCGVVGGNKKTRAVERFEDLVF